MLINPNTAAKFKQFMKIFKVNKIKESNVTFIIGIKSKLIKLYYTVLLSIINYIRNSMFLVAKSGLY